MRLTTSRLSCEPPFRLAAAGAARCLPPMNCMQRVATCKHRDAAPVLFDRGASAPGAVRAARQLRAAVVRRYRRLNDLLAYSVLPTLAICWCTTRSVQRPDGPADFSPCRVKACMDESRHGRSLPSGCFSGVRTCVSPGEVATTPLACGCCGKRSPASRITLTMQRHGRRLGDAFARTNPESRRAYIERRPCVTHMRAAVVTRNLQGFGSGLTEERSGSCHRGASREHESRPKLMLRNPSAQRPVASAASRLSGSQRPERRAACHD